MSYCVAPDHESLIERSSQNCSLYNPVGKMLYIIIPTCRKIQQLCDISIDSFQSIISIYTPGYTDTKDDNEIVIER